MEIQFTGLQAFKDLQKTINYYVQFSKRSPYYIMKYRVAWNLFSSKRSIYDYLKQHRPSKTSLKTMIKRLGSKIKVRKSIKEKAESIIKSTPFVRIAKQRIYYISEETNNEGKKKGFVKMSEHQLGSILEGRMRMNSIGRTSHTVQKRYYINQLPKASKDWKNSNSENPIEVIIKNLSKFNLTSKHTGEEHE